MHRVFVALLVLGVVLMSSPGRCPATTLPRTGRHTLAASPCVARMPLAPPDDSAAALDVAPAFVIVARGPGSEPTPAAAASPIGEERHRPPARRLLRTTSRPADDPTH